jgi:hypothetical protein
MGQGSRNRELARKVRESLDRRPMIVFKYLESSSGFMVHLARKKSAKIYHEATNLQKEMNYKAALTGYKPVKIDLPPQPDEDT